jgi:hypothetical protein
MGLHERHDLRQVGLLGENALANLKVSLVRINSAFSLRGRFSSSGPCWSTGHLARRSVSS